MVNNLLRIKKFIILIAKNHFLNLFLNIFVMANLVMADLSFLVVFYVGGIANLF